MMFHCRNCGYSKYRMCYSQLHDRFQGFEGVFGYGSCNRCNLIQIVDIPDNLANYYSDYRLHKHQSKMYSLFRRIIMGRCYPFSDAIGQQAVLDVGCGSGWYLKTMSKLGWKPFGYEMNSEVAESISNTLGYTVFSREEELERYIDYFDLITFNFSFEHLVNPKQLLRKMINCLKNDGKLSISAPNIQSCEASLFGNCWFHLDPPRHITFFPKSQLESILTEIGMRNIHIRNLAVPIGFAGSISYLLFDRFQPLAWYVGLCFGLIFCRIIRDGIYQISAIKPNYH